MPPYKQFINYHDKKNEKWGNLHLCREAKECFKEIGKDYKLSYEAYWIVKFIMKRCEHWIKEYEKQKEIKEKEKEKNLNG